MTLLNSLNFPAPQFHHQKKKKGGGYQVEIKLWRGLKEVNRSMQTEVGEVFQETITIIQVKDACKTKPEKKDYFLFQPQTLEDININNLAIDYGGKKK